MVTKCRLRTCPACLPHYKMLNANVAGLNTCRLYQSMQSKRPCCSGQADVEHSAQVINCQTYVDQALGMRLVVLQLASLVVL